MTSEQELREQLATCTRILAMQGMIGVFGHVSAYQPETKTVFITPGMGSDKGSLRPEDMIPTNLDGKPLEGKEGPPVELATTCRINTPVEVEYYRNGGILHTVLRKMLSA